MWCGAESEAEAKNTPLPETKRAEAARLRNFNRYTKELIESGRIYTAIVGEDELFWPSTTVKPTVLGGKT